jgi:integrase
MARREYQNPKVKLQKGPRPYWYIRYRVWVYVDKNEKKRREKRQVLGYCDQVTTKREAERLKDEVMRKVNRQVYAIGSHIRFENIVEKYRENHFPTLASSTKGKYGCHLDNHILPYFSGRRLSDVDTESIQRFLNAKNEEGLGWWTVSDFKNILSGIFTKVADWGYWDLAVPNPVLRTKLGRKHWKRERRILTDPEFRRLLMALPALIQLMIMTAVSTGLRVSELLGLKWRAVDLVRGWISVVERYYRGDTDVPKSLSSERGLSLGILGEAFRRLKPLDAKPEDYAFGEGGEPLDDREILKNYIRPAAERLGLYFPGFGWHSFRRQNITRIQEEGANTIDAQLQAGHSRPSMTLEYTIVAEKKRRRAVNRLQKKLLPKSPDWSPDSGFAGIVRDV